MNGLRVLELSSPMAHAEISPCGLYRYTLERRWARGPAALWVMLNPSTADARVDDRTITRCIDFSQELGYGGLLVGNLFALRATYPSELLTHPDPVGPENEAWLERLIRGAGVLIAGWGAHPFVMRRPHLVERFLALVARAGNPPVMCLGRTRAGAPKHPLYLPSGTPLVPWIEAAA